jgi:hypothetical protein
MKKIFVLLIPIMSLLLLSCITINDADSGNSHIIQKEFKIGSFSKLEISGAYNVFLSQGDSEKLVVKASEGMLQKFVVSNEGHMLKLDVKNEIIWSSHNRLDVYLTLKNIDELKLSGAGNIETNGTLKLTSLEITDSRTGNVSLHLECDKLMAELKSTGNVDFTGSAKEASIHKSGVGNLSASDFAVEYLKIDHSGVGNTDVYASKEISIKSSGVGNLSYKGDAIVKEYHTSGVGNVSKQ